MSEGKSGIRFFGKIDYNKAGKIASQIPAWAMEQHIEELREGIESKRRAIARGDMPMDAIPQAKAEIDKEEHRLAEILEGKPKLSQQEIDELDKIKIDLASKIGDSLFSYDDMMKGFANPHEEVKRMMKPIIKIDKKTAELCAGNGIRVEKTKDGLMVSRNEASRMYKIIRRYFGESGNVEELRRKSHTYATETVNR